LGHRPIFELRLRQCWWRWLLRKVGRAASLLHGSARLLAVAMPWGGEGCIGPKFIVESQRCVWNLRARALESP
jgi:hypothetical protein